MKLSLRLSFQSLGLLTFCIAGVLARAATEISPAIVADALNPLALGNVHLGGRVGEAIDRCVKARVMTEDVDALVAPFRAKRDKWEWRSEFWGKWTTSAVSAWQYSREEELRAKVAQGVESLIGTQCPDGYIGSYAESDRLRQWDLWGRKYTMLGLLSWYNETGDQKTLTALRRHADAVLAEVGPGKRNPLTTDMWSGMASSSIIEPMVLLYRATGDSKYLELAEYLVNRWADKDGPDLLRKALNGVPVFEMFPGPAAVMKVYADGGASKAYEMMSCYEGLVELYRTTGKAEYLDAVVKVFANIRDTEITVIGSGSDWERWNNGRMRQTEKWKEGIETCVTATWIKFAAQMLRVTGDAMYADEIERATYNALLASQAHDGSWSCHYAPLAGERVRAPNQCEMHANCCAANAPRALLLLPQIAVMNSADGLAVNYYGEMTAETSVDGATIRIDQKTDYPIGNEVTLTLHLSKPQAFPIQLRIPAWSEKTTMRVNDEIESSPAAGRFARIERTWRDGDRIKLHFDMRGRAVSAPDRSGYLAVLRGPLVLARDSRFMPSEEVDSPTAVRADLGSRDIAVRPVVEPSFPNVWQTFEVTIPGSAPSILCDFASAGNTWSKSSRYRVWIPTEYVALEADAQPR